MTLPRRLDPTYAASRGMSADGERRNWTAAQVRAEGNERAHAARMKARYSGGWLVRDDTKTPSYPQEEKAPPQTAQEHPSYAKLMRMQHNITPEMCSLDANGRLCVAGDAKFWAPQPSEYSRPDDSFTRPEFQRATDSPHTLDNLSRLGVVFDSLNINNLPGSFCGELDVKGTLTAPKLTTEGLETGRLKCKELVAPQLSVSGAMLYGHDAPLRQVGSLNVAGVSTQDMRQELIDLKKAHEKGEPFVNQRTREQILNERFAEMNQRGLPDITASGGVHLSACPPEINGHIKAATMTIRGVHDVTGAAPTTVVVRGQVELTGEQDYEGLRVVNGAMLGSWAGHMTSHRIDAEQGRLLPMAPELEHAPAQCQWQEPVQQNPQIVTEMAPVQDIADLGAEVTVVEEPIVDDPWHHPDDLAAAAPPDYALAAELRTAGLDLEQVGRELDDWEMAHSLEQGLDEEPARGL